jgi:ABC-2 type transport system permease protein
VFGVKTLATLYSSRELLKNLTLREIKGKYKRTVFGQAWSLLNPVAQMAIYSLVFGFVLRSNPDPGDPSGLDVFALWLCAALLPWLFFQNVVSSGMMSLVSNANLIQKVYFPRSTLVVSNALSWLFTFSIEMCVLVVALLIVGGEPLEYLPIIIFLMVLLAMFATGVAFMLSIANVYFRDTQHFLAILMQLWMYATPIIYPIKLIEEKDKQYHGLLTVYRLNPMERFSEAFRNGLYDNRWPTVTNMAVLVVVSVVVLGVGYAIFMRYEGRLAEEL